MRDLKLEKAEFCFFLRGLADDFENEVLPLPTALLFVGLLTNGQTLRSFNYPKDMDICKLIGIIEVEKLNLLNKVEL